MTEVLPRATSVEETRSAEYLRLRFDNTRDSVLLDRAEAIELAHALLEWAGKVGM